MFQTGFWHHACPATLAQPELLIIHGMAVPVSPRSDKAVKLMIQNVFPCHVTIGADAVLMAAYTLPHHASDGVQATAITHLAWMYNT